MIVVFFKQKTAYDMRISDWSSDVCSSDLNEAELAVEPLPDVDVHPVAPHEHALDQPLHHITADDSRHRGPKGPLVERPSISGQPDAPGVPPEGRGIGRATCREGVCRYV